MKIIKKIIIYVKNIILYLYVENVHESVHLFRILKTPNDLSIYLHI